MVYIGLLLVFPVAPLGLVGVFVLYDPSGNRVQLLTPCKCNPPTVTVKYLIKRATTLTESKPL